MLPAALLYAIPPVLRKYSIALRCNLQIPPFPQGSHRSFACPKASSPPRRLHFAQEMEVQHVAEQSLSICRRLFRFLVESFSFSKRKEVSSSITEADTQVPVIVYRHGKLGAISAPTEVPVESGEEPKKMTKKSVTIKDDTEVMRADIKKKSPSMPAKNTDVGEKEAEKDELKKEQEAVPAPKFSKKLSDINKRAFDYIQKKKQQILEKTASSKALGHSK